MFSNIYQVHVWLLGISINRQHVVLESKLSVFAGKIVENYLNMAVIFFRMILLCFHS